MPKVNKLEERPQQFNVQLPPKGIKLLTYYAEITGSIATAGTTKGQVSIGCLIRRISEGEINITYRGKPINVPVKHLLGIEESTR